MSKFKINPITGKMDMVGITEEEAAKQKPAIQEDITVIGVEIGGYKSGDTVTVGTLHDDVFKKMLQKRVEATYKAATASHNNAAHVVEMGGTVDKTSTASFVQNDAGALQGFSHTVSPASADGKNIVTITDAENTNVQFSYKCQNVVDVIRIETTYSHAEGEQKKDNMGEDSGTPIPEGSIKASPTITITPKLKFFYGACDAVPTESEAVRALQQNGYEAAGNITLKAKTGFTTFAVALPKKYSISKIIDTASLNADLTASYVKQPNTVNVSDALLSPSQTHEYNIYVLRMDIPYDSEKTHVITII